MMASERGAVSIFVVVFAALLMTIVTVGFVRIMVEDQNQATNNDLALSAYDSAMAGVEDAKRALLRYQAACQAGDATACDASVIGSEECNEVILFGGVVDGSFEGSATGGSGEIRVEQTTGDGALDQAYTCVTIDLETDDYVVDEAEMNKSVLVPLVGSSAYDTVQIEWFSNDDLDPSAGGAVTLSPERTSGSGAEPMLADWGASRPALLRSQLIQFGDSFTLDDFNLTPSASESNSNTVFLYPTTNGWNEYEFGTGDYRKTSAASETPRDLGTNTPLPVECASSVASGVGYSCRIQMELPSPVGGGDRSAYLRLTPLYNTSSLRIQLFNGATPVTFNGVQPAIDSTGRANDLFRRVVTRVNMVQTDFPYPEAALQLTGDLCKDFAVTDSQYIAGSCTP